MSDKNADRHRIDLWLKHACLYKQRSEATEDCNGGKVKINGNRVKAASPVRENDVIEISKGGRERKYVVLTVPVKQLAKEAARETYRDESPAPPPRDDLFAGRLAAPHVERGTGRPTKRDRRHMDRDGFGRNAPASEE